MEHIKLFRKFISPVTHLPSASSNLSPNECISYTRGFNLWSAKLCDAAHRNICKL
jgi:hypothetical protein